MKIVFLYSFNQGFLSAFFTEICEMLSCSGHEVKVFCVKRFPHQPENMPFDIEIKQRRSILRDYWEIFKMFYRERPDVVISNFRYVNPSLFFGKILGVNNNLAWFHSLNEQMQPTRLKIHIKRLFLKLADCVIANSTLTAVQLYEIYGVKKKKIETLPFWSNIDNQISEPQSKTLFLDKKNIVLGCPGRMVAHKNQKIVIKALSNLKKKGITNFELNFAGNGEDLSKLVDLAKNLEVASEINFLGHLSPNAMSKFYKTCDIIILPSLHEAFGLVFIEAVALNVPVLVSSSFGALSFIDPSAFDISKFSFNPESSKDLTEKLLAFKKHRFKPNFFRDLYLKTFDKREIFVKVMKAINQSKI